MHLRDLYKEPLGCKQPQLGRQLEMGQSWSFHLQKRTGLLWVKYFLRDATSQDQNMPSSRKGFLSPFGTLYLEHNHFVPPVSLKEKTDSLKSLQLRSCSLECCCRKPGSLVLPWVSAGSPRKISFNESVRGDTWHSTTGWLRLLYPPL